MAIVGPDFVLAGFLGGDQMEGVAGPEEEVAGCGEDESAGSPEEGFGDRDEVPKSGFNVVGKVGRELPGFSL